MKGYLIATLVIHDRAMFERYRERVLAIIRDFGGRNLVRGAEVQTIEGDLELPGLVVLEFPSLDIARAFYESPEYRSIKEMRLRSSDSKVWLVEGAPEERPVDAPHAPAAFRAGPR